jgi:cytochrome bd ubiquinol oxidase subunit II
MTEADVVTVVLWIAVTLYAVLGGADFGAGFWDLIAGGPERGAQPRALIDRVLTPVWEANHVWLIFMLVVTWTAFPDAFGAIMRTLFVPLFLAALGIVLRGSGFAFRHVVHGVAGQRALGATFALSSVITPFFMGTVVGAIATGQVPADGSGDRLDSWTGPACIAIGVLFVANCAYLAAVYLVSEAHAEGDAEMERYFRVRALAGGAAAGGFAALGLLALHGDARDLFDDLFGKALPLVLLSGVCGVATIVQLARRGAGARPLAVLAVASVVWGWGVAQRPYILPGVLTIDQAAAPSATLTALFVVFGAAALFVVPAVGLLFRLQQRRVLGEGDHHG